MNQFDHMDAYAAECIRCRVRRLVTVGSIRHDESDDLSQDILLEYYRRKPKFDARRSGYKTFTSRVVANAFSTLLSRRKRDLCRSRSIELVAQDGNVAAGDVTEAAVVDDPETRIAVDQALARLPHRIRQVAHGLCNDTPSAIAQSGCASRTTVYEAKKQIRTALQQGGFGLGKCRLSKPEVRR